MKKLKILMTVCALGYVFMTGCEGESSDSLSGEGEACDNSAGCHGDLRCIDNSCVNSGDGDADSDSDTNDGSDGCGEDPEGISLTLQIDGQSRSFELYLPPDYNPSRAYPLIFGWHGGGGTGAWSMSYWKLQEEAGSNAVVAYPDGLMDAEDATGWEVDPEGHDFVFFDALLEHLKGNLCIDEARLFSAGFSWGAYMSYSLGCYRADVLNAIAAVAGGPPRPKGGSVEDCDGQIATWIAHGTADYVIPLSEGEGIRDIFLENNGCQQTHSATDPDPCVTYDSCEAPMHWCQHEGGHDWPDFAAAGIWQFFSNQ